MKLSLRARIVAAAGFVVGLIIFAGIMFQLTYYRAFLHEGLRNQLAAQSRQVLTATHKAIYDKLQLLITIARFPVMGPGNEQIFQKLCRYLQNVIIGQQSIGTIDITNAEGIVIASSLPKRRGLNLSRTSAFVALKHGLQDTYVSELIGDGEDARLELAVRVLTEYGTFFGMVRMEYRCGRTLKREYDLLEREQNVIVLLLDSNEVVRIASEGARDLVGNRIELQGDEFELGGVEYIFSRASSIGYRSYLGQKLDAVLLFDKELALEPMYSFIKMFLLFALASSLLLMLILIVLTNRILKPIARLTAFTQEVSRSGDLSRRLPVEQEDEVGLLTASFNEMLARLSAGLERLERSEERNRRLLDAASQLGEGFLVVQEIQEDPWAIVDWNAAAARIMGIQPTAEGLPSLTDHIDTAKAPGFYTQLTALRERLLQNIPPSTLTIQDVVGNEKVIELSATLIDYQGEPSIAIIFRDITERLELQRQLINTQKLEVLGVLAGGFAHDFNNVLTGLLGYLELLKTQVSSPQANHYIEEMERIARRGAEMIKNILVFSKRRLEESKPVRIGEVLDEALTIVKSALPRSISVEVEGNTDAVINGDPSQLVQVFLNVLLNARDAILAAGREQGRIQIKIELLNRKDVAELGPSLLEFRNYVRVDVIDNGIGMDDEVKRRLFEPFFTTKGEKGSGLGLATTYRIVKNHEGEILVSSELGKGTTISILLPTGTSAALQDRIELPRSKASGTVLVVDDEETIRDSLKTVLASSGFEVLTAANGKEGLEILNKRPVDIVVLDLVMPVMGGKEFLKHLRNTGLKPRIVVISGKVELDESELEDVDAVLKKPFTLDTISRITISLATSKR